MLNDAIMSIRGADEQAQRRHLSQLSRRRPIQLIDHWLALVEGLIERQEAVVPTPLIGEIAAYVGRLDPLLSRKLQRRGESVWVLDVLFEAEEDLLVRAAAGPV